MLLKGLTSALCVEENKGFWYLVHNKWKLRSKIKAQQFCYFVELARCAGLVDGLFFFFSACISFREILELLVLYVQVTLIS